MDGTLVEDVNIGGGSSAGEVASKGVGDLAPVLVLLLEGDGAGAMVAFVEGEFISRDRFR
jgi:hypothetical protein